MGLVDKKYIWIKQVLKLPVTSFRINVDPSPTGAEKALQLIEATNIEVNNRNSFIFFMLVLIKFFPIQKYGYVYLKLMSYLSLSCTLRFLT